MTQTILIVEDSQELAQLLSDYLEQAGFSSHCLYQGDTVVEWVTRNRPNLVLLDIMLPGKNGVEIWGNQDVFRSPDHNGDRQSGRTRPSDWA